MGLAPRTPERGTFYRTPFTKLSKYLQNQAFATGIAIAWKGRNGSLVIEADHIATEGPACSRTRPIDDSGM